MRGYRPLDGTPGEPRRTTDRDLLGTYQLLLIVRLHLDLDATRLHAFLERHRQAQHAVAVRCADLLEIEELRTALKTIMGEEGEGMMWSERCEIARRALEPKP